MRTFQLDMVVVLCALCAGCSGAPGRVFAPNVDPDQAAKLALQELDQNGDSVLQSEELKACPPLVHAMEIYDADHDGILTKNELVAGISRWASARTGAILLPFRAQLDGRPLAGAKVKLIPVSFLENTIKPAQGTTDKRGAGMLGLAPEDRPSNAPRLPLVPPGLYRVEITHPSTEIPARFNSQSEIGLETSVAALNPAGVFWELRSKKK
jgi:hypothetical protein